MRVDCLFLICALFFANSATAFLPRHHHTNNGDDGKIVVLVSTTRTTIISSSSSLMSQSQQQQQQQPPIEGGFDSDQMEALMARGELEASLLAANVSPLEAPGTKASGTKKKKKKKKASSKKDKANQKPPSTAVVARELKQQGVVRWNAALTKETAAMVRTSILDRREEAYAALDSSNDTDAWRDFFADVLLKSNRCDLLLPLKGSRPVQLALRELLCGPNSMVSNIVGSTLTNDAVLYELAALISDPGAPRQPVHPDTPYQREIPLLTCFVALQDVLTIEMGPTTFLPRTHNTQTAHDAFDRSVPARDALLEASPSKVGLMASGDATLFDSRTLHCGGANAMPANGGTGSDDDTRSTNSSSSSTRAILYVSFRNPSPTLQPIGNVGSLLPEIHTNSQSLLTLGKLKTKLSQLKDDDESFDPFDDDSGNGNNNDNTAAPAAVVSQEPNRKNAYEAAAWQGDADAQFNLGLCYKLGSDGKPHDAAEAVTWFTSAAHQGHALAQCNLGSSYYVGEGNLAKDDGKAVQWFELAAQQGLAAAQHNLGFCYSTGVGVATPDLAQAAQLFHLAAEQGHPGAQLAYDEVLKEIRSSMGP